MTDERRMSARYPSFTMLDLVARDRQGEERTLSIITRDRNSSGIGGVYIGQEPVDPESTFFLKTEENTVRELKLAWGKKIAEYVYLLGFEILEA